MQRVNVSYHVILCAVAALSLVAITFQATLAATPESMSFQGVLYESGSLAPTGTYDVTFRLWNDPTSTSSSDKVFEETHPGVSVTEGVPVSLGIGEGTTSLGTIDHTLFADTTLWLEVEVNSSGPMGPRIRLRSVPYAFTVATVDSASGGRITSDVSVAGQIVSDSILTTKLRLPVGAGDGLILTSDDEGVASWEELSSASAWSLNGNSGTDATNYLGTADNHTLYMRVHDEVAFRLEPSLSIIGMKQTPNVIGGSEFNEAGEYVAGATISGGGSDFSPDPYGNFVYDHFGTIGGGRNNEAGVSDSDPTDSRNATVSGGFSNVASGRNSNIAGGKNNTASGTRSSIGGGALNRAESDGTVVSGGHNNLASGLFATVGGGKDNSAANDNGFPTVSGGQNNHALGQWSTVGGGFNNSAQGLASVVPGGDDNIAAGSYSFATGENAYAYHDNSFVWSDGSLAEFKTTETNQFLIRASNGVGINTDECGSLALAVNGHIGAREITVTSLSEWPDYVFAEDYDLMNLDQLESEIRSKGHLPDLPSAEVIAEDGISLGDMQSRLLKKVEELTLYVLEINKENENLRARLEELEAQTD